MFLNKKKSQNKTKQTIHERKLKRQNGKMKNGKQIKT